MNITINPNTFYKLFYNKKCKQICIANEIEYTIICTDDTDVYELSYKYTSDSLPIVYNIKYKRDSITLFNNYITKYCTLQNIAIEEISKEDVFLELL